MELTRVTDEEDILPDTEDSQDFSWEGKTIVMALTVTNLSCDRHYPLSLLFCPLFPFLVAKAGTFQTQEQDQTAPATAMTSYIPLPFYSY